MKDPNKQSILYLSFEPWMAQYFANKNYRDRHNDDEFVEPYRYNINTSADQLELIDIGRSGRVFDFLEVHLTKQPYSGGEDVSDCNLAIMIPNYSGKHPGYYTYLSARKRVMLHKLIRRELISDFTIDIQTWQSLGYNHTRWSTKSLIETWMNDHGIDITDTNYNALNQIYRRTVDAERLSRYRRMVRLQNKYMK